MRKGPLITIVLVASLALGVTLCVGKTRAAFKDLTALQTLTAPLDERQAHYFFIVGFDKGQPSVVHLDEIKPDGTFDGVDTFYVPKAELAGVTTKVHDALAGDESMAVEIQRDDPASHRQRITTNVHSDDFTYVSVYDVDGATIQPVAYADVTKRDGVQAFRAGFPRFLASLFGGVILAITLGFFMRSRPPLPPRAPRPRS